MADKKVTNISKKKGMTMEEQVARANEIALEIQKLADELARMEDLQPAVFTHLTFLHAGDKDGNSMMYTGSGGFPMNVAVTMLQNPEFQKIVPYLGMAAAEMNDENAEEDK